MQKKVVFGSWEAICLLISMIGTKAVLNFPRTLADISGTAGWLLSIYIALLAMAGFYIIAVLYRNQCSRDLLDISSCIAGSAGRVITGIIMLIFISSYIFTELRQFGEQMKTMAYTTSPVSYILFFFMIGIIAAAYFGIQAIVRFQAVLVPVSIVAFLTYLLLLAPYYNFSNVLPLLGNGPNNLFVKGFSRISEYSELLFLFLIVPFIGSHSNFKKVGYISIAASAFFLTSLTFAYLSIIPYPASLEFSLPAHELGRLISYGRFFQRVESLFIVTWATMAFMYLGAAFYFLVHVFRKTFRLNYEKPLIFPSAIVIFSITLLPQSQLETKEIIASYLHKFSGFVTFGLTIIILAAANIMMKKEK